MSGQFELGAVVKCAKTGRKMTIYQESPVAVGGVPAISSGSRKFEQPTSDKHVRCVWFEGKVVKRDKFEKSSLTIIEPATRGQILEGQVVRLASGGPELDVTRVGPWVPPAVALSSAAAPSVAPPKVLAFCKLVGSVQVEKFEPALLRLA